MNIEDDTSWVLLVSWLVACLNPAGPFPILILQGEQGSAKSTAARVLKSLVDPGKPPLRSCPRDERDMMIAATNSWILSYDNLSGTQQWLSDALCRLSTGGGFSTRELHSDNEETLFDASRPVVLNGIDDVASNPDLADRAVIVTLQAIPPEKRKSERRFWMEFERARPGILGALLDAVSAGLKKGTQNLSLEKLPRMADFAEWICSCCCESVGSTKGKQEPVGALPFTAEQFINIYVDNRSEAVSVAIESSPLAAAVERFAVTVERQPALIPADNSEGAAIEKWKGTAAELLDILNTGDRSTEETRRSREWPRDVRSLGNKLRRLAGPLRSAGVNVAFSIAGHAKTRTIKLSLLSIHSSFLEKIGKKMSATSATETK